MKTYWPLVVLALLIIVGGAYFYFAPRAALAPSPAAHNLSADVYPLYNGLTWGAEEATTSSSFVGYGVVSQTISGISDLSAVSAPFDNYYKTKLLALGWSADISLEAGGPGAEVLAYKKGGEHIILGYNTVFHGGGINEPEQCPCDITFSIFSGSDVSADYKNATYTIEGQPVTLVDGYAEVPAAPGSASKTVTQYFGNEAVGDLNGDGVPDVAFLLTQNGGGSGTFYYVVAALKTAEDIKGRMRYCSATALRRRQPKSTTGKSSSIMQIANPASR